MGRCYWNLSEARTAWRTLRRAISISQEHADGVAQAKATVEILRIWGPPERHRSMAEDALEALGDSDPYLHALLLLDLGWQDEPADDDTNIKYDQALALAEEHGFEDILASRVQRQAWSLMDDGQLDEAIALFENAHETYARLHVHHVAGGGVAGGRLGDWVGVVRFQESRDFPDDGPRASAQQPTPSDPKASGVTEEKPSCSRASRAGTRRSRS